MCFFCRHLYEIDVFKCRLWQGSNQKINSLQIGRRSLSIRLFLASLQIDFILIAYWLTKPIGKTINIILDNQNDKFNMI